MKKQRLFILYDGRAKPDAHPIFRRDPDDCSILDTARSTKEAWKSTNEDHEDMDAIWYEYDVDTDGKTLINEKPRPDIGKGVLL